MTTLSHEDRSDAIARGGAYQRLIQCVEIAHVDERFITSVPTRDVIEIIRDALQLRRDNAALKAQHERDLTALRDVSFCEWCDHQWQLHGPLGCTAVFCECVEKASGLQSLRKPSPDPVADGDGGAQGGHGKATT